ncbi:MAG: hypothetical protein V4751_14165 [Pseudomonadota bacterium]
MTKETLLYCATDKEIHDALMSAKQKINESILLELARDRGIFYSVREPREDLIKKISLLPHDFHDLNLLLEQREHAGRSEKITSVTLDAALTVEEIKDVVRAYTEDSPDDERVTHYGKGANQVVVNVKYSDVNYGKTRLVQRTAKEAGIEFHVESDKTIIRMPANLRVKGIFEKLKDRIDSNKKTEINAVRIEIGEFKSPALRTEFFTTLISTLQGFRPEDVTSIKIEKLPKDLQSDELDLEDDQSTEEAREEALSFVKNVALRGSTLLASEEYQSFVRKGFFITSIIWRSKLVDFPNPIIEFEAAFEEPDIGAGFKYYVRGCYNVVDKHYTKTIRPIDKDAMEKYLTLIEETAAATIAELRKKVSSGVNGELIEEVSDD